MDFITHLPLSAGFTVVFVVVDRFSKAAHFLPLPSRYTAPKVAQTFWDGVGKLHGLPATIVSDRDPLFLSDFWQKLFSLQGTKLCYSSAYHPQSDGQTERLNRCLETYLRVFAHEHPSSWHRYLSWAEYHYNTTHHHSTGFTPFEVVYGRRPPNLLAHCLGHLANEAVASTLQSRMEILASLKANLLRAQQRMKAQADKKRSDITFKIGDLVLLRLQPYRQLSVHRRSSQKLALRFYGPFPVLAKIGPVAYRLGLPPASRVHPVFHVSLLRPFHASASYLTHPFPESIRASTLVHVPCAVVAERQVWRHDRQLTQVLVQWSGLRPEDATWEDKALLLDEHGHLLLSPPSEFSQATPSLPPLSDVMTSNAPNPLNGQEVSRSFHPLATSPSTVVPNTSPEVFSAPQALTHPTGNSSTTPISSSVSATPQPLDATRYYPVPKASIPRAFPRVASHELSSSDAPDGLEDEAQFEGEGDVMANGPTHGEPRRRRVAPKHLEDFVLG